MFCHLNFPGLNTRSLSLFRIGVAILVLVDLALRLQNYGEHYTEAGIAPIRWISDKEQNSSMNWSVFFFHFSETWTRCVFGLVIVSALGLLGGYRTKFFSISTWVLMLSLHARSPLILFGADSMVSVLLFWGMWLPLGHHWSLDAVNRGSSVAEVRSGATLGITIQIAMIYWMNAITKGGPEWRDDFTAIERALRIDYFSTGFGEYLIHFPALLKAGTHFTLCLEELVPFALFLPFFRGHLKSAAVFLMVFFHIGMLGTTMHLGIFPYIGAIAWLPFLPSSFWARFSKTSGDSPVVAVRAPKIASVICCGIITFLLLWNVRHALRQENPWYLPKSLNWIGRVTRLQQRWSLFAPRVNTTDGWMIAEATLKNGNQVDLLNHGAVVDFTRPAKIESRIQSCRERTYLLYLFQSPDPLRVEIFVQSLKNRWAATEGGEIQSIKLYMMHEDNREPEKGVRRFLMWPYEVETINGEAKFKEKPIEKVVSN